MMIWIVAALVLFIIQMGTILFLEFRYPSKAMAWLIILYVFPFVGFIVYYFMAQEYKQRKKVSHKIHGLSEDTTVHIHAHIKPITEINQFYNDEMRNQERLYHLLASISEAPITACNKVNVLNNADETYTAMIHAIERAVNHIHIEFYTFRSDQTGVKFKDLLVAKSKEGVKVRLIFDGVGSYGIEEDFLNEMKQCGIEQRFFLPLKIALFKGRMNYRNHRKIVVVDGKIAFQGGINIGDEYLGHDPKLKFWRDTHMSIEGDAVYCLQQLFLTDWYFVSGEMVHDINRYFPLHDCQHQEQVQIINGGPDRKYDSILNAFFTAINSAKKNIYITSPYFIPDKSMERALLIAALSGVEVRVIIPNVADSKIVQLASYSYLEQLMKAGVKFYEYKKGFIHSKILIVDSMVASIGTANMDMRSFFSNFEINALMFDRNTIERITEDYMIDLKDSEEITLSKFEQRSKTQRSKEIIARLLSPLL